MLYLNRFIYIKVKNQITKSSLSVYCGDSRIQEFKNRTETQDLTEPKSILVVLLIP